MAKDQLLSLPSITLTSLHLFIRQTLSILVESLGFSFFCAEMDVSSCNLSKYGYSFVVATTQLNINSSLKGYLLETTQPDNFFCFVSDPTTGNPATQISLDDLKAKSGGNDPFEIPAGTSATDPRIQALTSNSFAFGVKIRMGLPPGVPYENLPLILELRDGAQGVIFRMFCSDFQIIQNIKGDGDIQASWNVWSQQSGSPVYVETVVDLVNADLDKELSTPYFDQNPAQKATIRSQIENMSDSAFSLQQLLLDLDNAALQSAPSFKGIPDTVQSIVEEYFVGLYIQSVKNYGQPLISITPVPDTTTDPSSIQMTSFDRVVNRFKDANGAAIDDPSPEQLAMTTLDHLCMTNNLPLPDYEPFTWNWVQTQNAGSQGGVVAISRQVILNYLLNTALVPGIEPYCINAMVAVLSPGSPTEGGFGAQVVLTNSQTPQTCAVQALGDSAGAISIAYTSPGDTQSNNDFGFTYKLQVQPNYTCDVSVNGSSIVIVQRLWVLMHLWSSCSNPGDNWNSQQPINAFDKTLTDTYNMSFGQDGGVQITRDASVQNVKDASQDPDPEWDYVSLYGFKDAVQQARSQITFAAIDMSSVSIPGAHNFVFPGSQVAAYSSATFSNYQDLVCNITYLDASEIFPPQSTLQATPLMEEELQPTVVTQSNQPILAVAESSPNAVTLTHTCDMIQNWVQGEAMAPMDKFEALQTDDGHSLLFGIDSDNIFHVSVEQSGTSKTGWGTVDLSTTFLQKSFSGDTSASVRTFDVNQSTISGTISMAMAVTSKGADNLFFSLQNPSSSSTWNQSDTTPTWTSAPFDAPNETTSQSNLSIVGTMFAETNDQQQFLIVDIDRSSTSTVKDIARYYVDPLKGTGTFWTSHDVPVDIEDGTYQSCVGRLGGRTFGDGVYTSGVAGGSPQLCYNAIYNPFGGPSTPYLFSLPSDAQASAIATARNPDHSTDLYAVGGSVLYRLPAGEQVEHAVATTVMSNGLFSGTTKLSAMTNNGTTTIWGKNGGDMVYYVSCPNDQLNVPTAWSTPVPILTEVELMSPYVNLTSGGNTIFTSGDGTLQRLVQATNTEAQMWKVDGITLAPSDTTAASTPFNSYTTTIQVVDDQNLPVDGASVSITAASHTPAYINGLYYVLSQTPTTLQTDRTGILTVVEAVHDSINGTVLTVTCDNGTTSTTINPMDKPFQKMSALNTSQAVLNAEVSTNVKAGGTLGPSSSKPLVAPSTSSDAVTTVANSMSDLGTVYGSVSGTTPASPSSSPAPATAVAAPAPSTGPPPGVSMLFGLPSLGDIEHDLSHALESTVGDITRFLKSVAKHAAHLVKHIVNIVKDAASGAWHFVANIMGQVYKAALTTVDAVVGAVEWVFNAVETAIEDIIQFLEFLFEWDDITRTKDVIYNLTTQWMSGQIACLPEAKTDFDAAIASVESSISQWAGITDWSASLGDVGPKPNPAAGQTSGSQMLTNHFKNHGSDATVVGAPTSADAAQELFDGLLTALEKEGQNLSDVYTSLKELAGDFASKSLGDVLKALVGIVANSVLSSVQAVGSALFDVLISLSTSALDLLTTPIHIPVISDILDALGVPKISFLEVICWVAAVAYTIVYKIAHNEAPFPDTDDISNLISAQSWADVQALLGQPPQSSTPAAVSFELVEPQAAPSASFMATETTSTQSHSLLDIIPVSASTAKQLYISLHGVGSFMTLLSAMINGVEAEEATGSTWGTWSSIIGAVIASSNFIADTALPEDSIQGSGLVDASRMITGLTIAAKVTFSGKNQSRLKVSNPSSFWLVKDGRATGAIVNVLLAIPALGITAAHFYELSNDQASTSKSAAIAGELANLAGYVSRVAYCMAVNETAPTNKQIPIGFMVGDIVLTSMLMASQSLVVDGIIGSYS
ncbi:hypothetical protein AK830_g1610 [Neonectria ditissima]|uniref:Uncharacterized protein n=1 Tax=Neonectria ditissima TaxID=78410 RepID=A0A0P7BE17_9HYPO|nr:hypothetical protein AK830_g1610 [Neonectria ditissima]